MYYVASWDHPGSDKLCVFVFVWCMTPRGGRQVETGSAGGGGGVNVWRCDEGNGGWVDVYRQPFTSKSYLHHHCIPAA